MPSRYSVRAGEFSALEGFFAAYLHEDYQEEHATPADALAEFLDDATPGEVERLRNDWQTFRARVDGLPEAERIRLLVHTLGSAWTPESFADVDVLFAKLAH